MYVPSYKIQVSVCCWINLIYNVFKIECVSALEKLLKEHAGRYATGDEVFMVCCYSLEFVRLKTNKRNE